MCAGNFLCSWPVSWVSVDTVRNVSVGAARVVLRPRSSFHLRRPQVQVKNDFLLWNSSFCESSGGRQLYLFLFIFDTQRGDFGQNWPAPLYTVASAEMHNWTRGRYTENGEVHIVKSSKTAGTPLPVSPFTPRNDWKPVSYRKLLGTTVLSIILRRPGNADALITVIKQHLSERSLYLPKLLGNERNRFESYGLLQLDVKQFFFYVCGNALINYLISWDTIVIFCVFSAMPQ